jgi:hypothetical protein
VRERWRHWCLIESSSCFCDVRSLVKCLPTWRAEGDLQIDGEHIEHVKFCPDCFYIEVGVVILAGLGNSIVATGSFFQYVAYGVGERSRTAGNRGKLILCHTLSPFLRECNLSTGRVWEIASVEINQNLPDIFVFAVLWNVTKSKRSTFHLFFQGKKKSHTQTGFEAVVYEASANACTRLCRPTVRKNWAINWVWSNIKYLPTAIPTFGGLDQCCPVLASQEDLVPIPTFFFNLENVCFQSNEIKKFNRTLGPVLDLVIHMSRLLVPKFSRKLLSESNFQTGSSFT